MRILFNLLGIVRPNPHTVPEAIGNAQVDDGYKLPHGCTLSKKQNAKEIKLYVYHPSSLEPIASCLAMNRGVLYPEMSHIHTLQVHESFANKGIGTYLIELMIRELPSNQVSLFNDHPGNLYSRIGFEHYKLPADKAMPPLTDTFMVFIKNQE